MSPSVPVPNSHPGPPAERVQAVVVVAPLAGPSHSSQCRSSGGFSPLGARRCRRSCGSSGCASRSRRRWRRPRCTRTAGGSPRRVALVAHLRVDLVLRRLGRERAGFVRCTRSAASRQKTLLAEVDGADRGRGVVVVGRGDQHRVDVLVRVVEHLAVVVEDCGCSSLRRHGLRTASPSIFSSTSTSATSRSFAASAGVAAALPAAADDGDAELLVRGPLRPRGCWDAEAGSPAADGGVFEERSPRRLAGGHE